MLRRWITLIVMLTSSVDTFAWTLSPAAGSAIEPQATLLCLQGDRDRLAAVLNEMLSSPLAVLWQHSTVATGLCAARGFTAGGDSDECFSNLTMWYAPNKLPNYPGVPRSDQADLWQWARIVDGALVGWDFSHGLPNGTAATMSCQRNLIPGATRGAGFTTAHAVPGSPSAAGIAVGSHVPDAGLLCNEGPLTGTFTIFDMVAILKNDSLGAIQQVDGVQNVSCAARGFAIVGGAPDHCYPPSTMMYTGNVFMLYQAQWLETGAMLAYDFEHRVAPGTAERIAACDCLPGSEVRDSLPSHYCDGSSSSPGALGIRAPTGPLSVGLDAGEWTEVNAHAPWPARNMPSTVTFQGEVWMLGGAGAAGRPPLYSDVWSSVDGREWRQRVPDGKAPWEPRSCMPTVVHRDRMVMMGGCQGYTRFADVWESADGTNWTLLTARAGWTKRCCFPAVVVGDALVISGGHDLDDYRNDVWRSYDGITWTELTPAAPFGVRDGHAAVVLNGAIIIIGGHDGRTTSRQWHGDVWRSADGGSHWTQLTAKAEFPARDGAFAAVINGTVVILGGFAGDSFHNDAWVSNSGEHWSPASPALAGWSGRAFFGASVIPSPLQGYGQLLVFGGWQGPDIAVVNDAWVL